MPMTGAPGLQGQVHDVDDLLGVHLAQRTAEDGEILGIDVNHPVVDLAEAGDHAVAQEFLLFQAEVGRMVRHVALQLDEGVGVEQVLDAVAGRHQAAGPALGQLVQAAGRVFFLAQFDQFLDFGFHLHHLWGKLYNHSLEKANPAPRLGPENRSARGQKPPPPPGGGKTPGSEHGSGLKRAVIYGKNG